jgi:hypothetical protein
LEPLEVVQGVVNAIGESNPVVLFVAKGFLQEAEESSCAWQGECHGAKLTNHSVPFLFREALLTVGDVIEQFV